MKRFASTLVSFLLVLFFGAGVLVQPVYAAKPNSSPKPASTIGNDVSYPQCDRALPKGQAFAIVGVNGGLATIANPCLSQQLQWAASSTGSVASQPKTQLYVNTANPGQVLPKVATWPRVGETPYGSCDGTNSMACSWQYGRDRAVNDVSILLAVSPLSLASDYVWWLDVETENSWQEGSQESLERNRATLEGMTSYFTSQGARVGIYSTNYQWGVIAGVVPSSSNLYVLDSWMAGARTERGAKINCSNAPLVAGGQVSLSQYVSKGLDYDVSCL